MIYQEQFSPEDGANFEELSLQDAIYLAHSNIQDVESLKIIGFVPEEYYGDLYLSEGIQENLLAQAKRWSAIQKVSRVVIFELNAEEYAWLVDVANFDGDWRIVAFGGTLANLLFMDSSLQGIIFPIFIDEIKKEFLGDVKLHSILISP